MYILCRLKSAIFVSHHQKNKKPDTQNVIKEEFIIDMYLYIFWQTCIDYLQHVSLISIK